MFSRNRLKQLIAPYVPLRSYLRQLYIESRYLHGSHDNWNSDIYLNYGRIRSYKLLTEIFEIPLQTETVMVGVICVRSQSGF